METNTQATATLPSTGATNYISSTPPALANPMPVPTPSTTQQAQTPAPANDPLAQTQVPQPPPVALPDFSAFESARGDLPSTTPQPATAPVVAPNVVPSPAPASPAQAPAVIPTPVAAPAVKPTVDAQGNPIPIELDLTQSAFAPQTQTPPIVPSTALPGQQPTNLPTHENGRDYTGFDEQEREVFRKMANESFNYLAPKYREARSKEAQLQALTNEKTQLQQQLQQRPTDPLTAVNPLGYVFTPEFAQITQFQQNAQFENNYWQQQLAVIRSGKGKPRGLNFVNGQYTQGPEYEPTPQTEAWITNQMAASNNNLQQATQAEQQLRVGYQTQAARDLQIIESTEDKYFPWFAKGKTHSFQPVIDGFIAQLPPTQRANPLGRALGKAYALVQYLSKELETAKKTGLAPATVLQNPTGVTGGNPSIAGPGVNGTANGIPNNTGHSTDITMDAFNAIKNSY